MDTERGAVLLTSIIFAFVGLWALIDPAGMVSVVDLHPRSPDALADVRAMYGGLELAIATLLLYHAAEPERVPNGLALGALFVAGIGGGRLLGQLISGFTGMSSLLLVFELGAAAVLAGLWWRAQ